MSWNILSPLIFCVKSTLQYLNCTQQPHTGERAKSWTSPQRNPFFLPANLSNDARIQEQHLSITFECGLSASSLRTERSFIFGTILTCWELTHGEKDTGAGQRREIKVRETEDSLWKKVYLSLRKQTKSKAGRSSSKNEEWWSNSPPLHCLWQTVHLSSQVNTRRFQRKISFILICSIQVCWVEFTAVFLFSLFLMRVQIFC